MSERPTGFAVAVLGLVLCIALAPAPAAAHGTMQAGDFYAGLLQPAFHLESLLLLVALSLWTGQLQPPDQGRLPAAFSAAVLVGGLAGVAGLGEAAAGAAAWSVRGGALALGLLVASRPPQPRTLRYGLAIVLGLGQGHLGSLADRAALTRPLLYVLGLALAPLVLGGLAIGVSERFQAFWVQVAFRIAGSWIATVALLVSALQLAGPR